MKINIEAIEVDKTDGFVLSVHWRAFSDDEKTSIYGQKGFARPDDQEKSLSPAFVPLDELADEVFLTWLDNQDIELRLSAVDVAASKTEIVRFEKNRRAKRERMRDADR